MSQSFTAPEHQVSLPSTEQLLVAGGDARIALDAPSGLNKGGLNKGGLNKYGCRPFPDPQLLAFGSSTASVISTAGFAAANRLREKLVRDTGTEPHELVYAREIRRIRSELLRLCELSDVPGLEVVFATSGTELHLIAGQYAGSGVDMPALVVMVEADETGSGVAAALVGRHFNPQKLLENSTPIPPPTPPLKGGEHAAVPTLHPPLQGEGWGGDGVNTANEQSGFNATGAPIAGGSALEVVSVPIRLADGTPRQLGDIDTAVEALVTSAVALGRRVLLILVDQSKTGLIAPSPACVAELHRRLPDGVEVLVDACQFRIAPPTLRAYLAQGFMVALTGSKFVTGPSFSGALLLPSAAAQRLRGRPMPRILADCSSSANWPSNWNVAGQQTQAANFGLLLRWEVALEELRRFRSVPQAEIVNFLQDFAQAMRSRLISDPFFAPLPVPQLDRRPLIEAEGWDQIQTIFPFLLYRPATDAGRLPLCREETARVYRRLQADPAEDALSGLAHSGGDISPVRCQLGQPVACGTRDGVAVSALRICASARLVSEAFEGGKGAAGVIEDALAALDKTVLLIQAG